MNESYTPPDPNRAVATPDTYRTYFGLIWMKRKSPKSTLDSIVIYWTVQTGENCITMTQANKIGRKMERITQKASGCLLRYAVRMVSLSFSET